MNFAVFFKRDIASKKSTPVIVCPTHNFEKGYLFECGFSDKGRHEGTTGALQGLLDEGSSL